MILAAVALGEALGILVLVMLAAAMGVVLGLLWTLKKTAQSMSIAH